MCINKRQGHNFTVISTLLAKLENYTQLLTVNSAWCHKGSLFCKMHVWYETTWYVHSTAIIKAYDNWFHSILSTNSISPTTNNCNRHHLKKTWLRHYVHICLALCSFCLNAKYIYINIYNEKLPNQQMTEQYFHTSFLAQHLLSWQAKNEVAANKSWAKWLSNMPRIPDTCWIPLRSFVNKQYTLKVLAQYW